MERTVRDVVEDMDESLRVSLYSAVGYMIEIGCLNMNEWDYLKEHCTNEQFKVCLFLIKQARKQYMKNA